MSGKSYVRNKIDYVVTSYTIVSLDSNWLKTMDKHNRIIIEIGEGILPREMMIPCYKK